MSLGKTRGAAAALLAISMLASLVLAQAASAATVTTKKACYVTPGIDRNGEKTDQIRSGIPVAATGLPPEEYVVFWILDPENPEKWVLGEEVMPGTASGSVSGDISGTYSLPGDLLYAHTPLQVLGRETGEIYAETPVWMAYREVRISPSKGVKPRDTVNFDLAGFKSGRPFYAHYVHKGREILSQKLGTTHGHCGQLHARAKLFPAKHSHFGTYEVQFDNSKKYNPKAHPKVVQELTTGRF